MRSLRVYAVLYLLFLYAPIVLLPIFAFNDSAVISFPLSGATTQWFTGLADEREMTGALRTSILIALISASFATVLGIFAAMAGTRSDFPAKRPILGLIMLPLVLPEVIVATSLLIVIVQVFGLDPGAWSIIVAHVLICTPFSVAILNSAFQNLDPALEEAALDLGESRRGAFRRVTLPLIVPGIVSSFLIAFTISLDEFIIAFFMSGNTTTLPVYIYGLTRFPGKMPLVMALGTLLVAASIILLIAAEAMRRRGLRRAGLKDTGGFL
ncbi:MAG: spermidine/putrescine transport system permease protein [Rhodobacteraceae bacterium HLUCCA08]|nr:MAG: spermidine/putrescine transport system permease protein [Rhodobacteraceae bacterium HLUCCA08]